MKTYFNIQLAILVFVDILMAICLLIFRSKNCVILADIILGLVQFFPSLIIAIIKFEKYSILFGYVLFCILVMILFNLFPHSNLMTNLFYYFCFAIAHAFVFMLYKIQNAT
jgi:hypothetical protein